MTKLQYNPVDQNGPGLRHTGPQLWPPTSTKMRKVDEPITFENLCGRRAAYAIQTIGRTNQFPVAYDVDRHGDLISAWERLAGVEPPENIPGIDMVVCVWPVKSMMFVTAPTAFYWFWQGRLVGSRSRMAADDEVDVLADMDAANAVLESIPRHHTAMSRKGASVPVKLAIRDGIIPQAPGVSVFDYGMGRGYDVGYLKTLGYDASGYDPHYAPDAQVRKADVVFLNYVLNVIEDEAERAETLTKAFQLADRALVVAVRVGDKVTGTPYKDGVLTSTGTFQKIYTQPEFLQYLRGTLPGATIQAAKGIPGVVYVLRAGQQEGTTDMDTGKALWKRESTADILDRAERVLQEAKEHRILNSAPVRKAVQKVMQQPYWPKPGAALTELQVALEKFGYELDPLPSIRDSQSEETRLFSLAHRTGPGDGDREDVLNRLHFAWYRMPSGTQYEVTAYLT